MSKQTTERYYPVPGAIDGGQWVIDEASAAPPQVSLNKRGPGGTMFVPLDESERSRYVRYHELGHVKYSPKQVKNKPEEVPDWVLGAAEDGRVTELLSRHAPPPMNTEGFTDIERLYNLKHAFESDNDLFMASLLFSKMNTQDVWKLRTTAQEMTNRAPNSLDPPTAEDNALWKRFERAFRIASKIHDAHIGTKSDANLANFTKTSIAAAKDLVRFFSPETDEQDGEGDSQEEWDQEGFEEMFEEYLESLAQEEGGGYERDMADDACWGAMQIHTYPMKESLPAKLRSPRRRSSDVGVYPRNIHRWCSDKAVFSRKVRADGGTVLIDASGSMHWDHETLVEVVKTIPAGTVALYSGAVHTDGWREMPKNEEGVPFGALRIIAREGKYVGDSFDRKTLPNGNQVGGGNLIDGPALEWLGQQEGPRIWISDAMVIGWSKKHEADFTNSVLTEHCVDLMKRHRIVRLNDLSEVIDYMERRKNRG